MGASLSILLALLAQAAAPSPPPGCNPPCGAGQYCASDGRCYVAAPPPPAPPGCSPACAAGQYCASDGRCYVAAPPAPPPAAPAPDAYAPPPNQPQAYPPAQNAPAPGYYQPPQGQPGAYQQPAPYGQQPTPYGSPPPGVHQPQPRPVRAGPTYKEGPRFGLFLGGLALPADSLTAFAGGAILTFGSQPRGFETRIYGALYTVDEEDTKTTGSVFVAHGTRWWGVYGLGFGSGIGYADFTAKSSYGWNDSSPQLIAYVAPVMLRFGRQPTFEFGLNSGASMFFTHDVGPYGYLYGAILF
jgi:hypothetical protein